MVPRSRSFGSVAGGVIASAFLPPHRETRPGLCSHFSKVSLPVALGFRRWTVQEADQIAGNRELQRIFGETLSAVRALKATAHPKPATVGAVLDRILPSADELAASTSMLEQPSRILIHFSSTDVRVFRHRDLPEHTVVYCEEPQVQGILRAGCPNLIMEFNVDGFATVPVPIKQVATAIELAAASPVPLVVEEPQATETGG